jgi:hypothetical protein
LRQYLYFCSSKASKRSTKFAALALAAPQQHAPPQRAALLPLRAAAASGTQFTGFTSTKVQMLTQKISSIRLLSTPPSFLFVPLQLLRQHLYLCTSKASKLSLFLSSPSLFSAPPCFFFALQ